MPLTLSTPRPGDERYADIEVQVEGFSWRAALAGVFIALAIASALHLLGAAIGFTPASFGLENAPEAATAGIMTTIWLTLATVIGFFVGGYVSGYAVPTIARRDGCVRGMVVWAITVMVVGLIGASTVMRASSAAIKGVTSVAATTMGTAAGLGAAGIGAAAAQQGQQQGGIDRLGDLARRITEDMSATPTAQMSPEQAGQDFGRLMIKRVRDGSWQDADKTRASELLARVSNTSVDDARTKLEAVEARIQQEMQEAQQKAKTAAETAAKALAAATFWAFLTVALGLLAAGAGGHLGARRWVA